MPTNRGFTLIEILVVIVIIGITIGFALLSYGDFGASRRLQFAAEHLIHTLKLAQQQAILEHSTFGLKIDNTSYQILKFYANNSKWAPISDKGIYKVTYLPQNTVIKFKNPAKNLFGAPPIMIHSTGDMTPFTMYFGTNKDNTYLSITGLHNGSLKLSEVDKK